MDDVCVLVGRANSDPAVKGGEEDGSSSGLEEDSAGPQGHSWTSPLTCRESPDSPGPGHRVHRDKPPRGAVLTRFSTAERTLSLCNRGSTLFDTFTETCGLLSEEAAADKKCFYCR